MGQYNLITYCLFRKKPTCSAIQRFLFHYELLDKHRYEESMDIPVDLKKLIFEHLLEKSKIALELKVCKELCACRGERVLKNAKCLDCINKEKNKKQNQIARSDFQLMMTWITRVSFTKLLNGIKALF